MFCQLFAQWKQEHAFDAFISDGIVDGTAYASPRILFVLREMNCRSERDLCADLRCHGSGWKTWNNIGRWTAALLDGESAYPKDMPAARRAAQLKRVAVINVKKEGGGPRAVGSELEKAVREQAPLLRREIALCNPDLIVCCGLSSGGCKGNAALLKEYVLESTTAWESFASALEGRTWWYYYAELEGRRIPVISFCHPQVTVLGRLRGHRDLFQPLYQDMLTVRKRFLRGS